MYGISDTLINGAIATTSVGAISGFAIGLARGRSPVSSAILVGSNAGITGLTFFGSREYLISPLLESHNISKPAPGTGGDRLVDSACAGAFTGALWNGVVAGHKRIFPGAISWSLLATGLQFAWNETLASARHRDTGQAAENAKVSAVPKGSSDYVMDALTWVAPVKKMTDEEYLGAMRKKQDAIERRLSQTDHQSPPSSRTSQ